LPIHIYKPFQVARKLSARVSPETETRAKSKMSVLTPTLIPIWKDPDTSRD